VNPAERWKRIQEICEQAERLAVGERAAFLAAADADLRDAAEALLAAIEAEESLRIHGRRDTKSSRTQH
jgi:hypothetical protein